MGLKALIILIAVCAFANAVSVVPDDYDGAVENARDEYQEQDVRNYLHLIIYRNFLIYIHIHIGIMVSLS